MNFSIIKIALLEELIFRVLIVNIFTCVNSFFAYGLSIFLDATFHLLQLVFSEDDINFSSQLLIAFFYVFLSTIQLLIYLKYGFLISVTIHLIYELIASKFDG